MDGWRLTDRIVKTARMAQSVKLNPNQNLDKESTDGMEEFHGTFKIGKLVSRRCLEISISMSPLPLRSVTHNLKTYGYCIFCMCGFIGYYRHAGE